MIDWDRVAELHDEIGAESFKEVVVLFLEEVETTVSALPGGAMDPKALETQLHFLKGSALNLGFRALAALCQSGESAARKGAAEAVDLNEIARVYDRSRQAFLRELPDRLAA